MAWQDVPIVAYKAAVKALDGPDCLAALDMAREIRSKLGDSTNVSWGLGRESRVVCL